MGVGVYIVWGEAEQEFYIEMEGAGSTQVLSMVCLYTFCTLLRSYLVSWDSSFSRAAHYTRTNSSYLLLR